VCLPVYGSATSEKSAKKLWNCLRLEIFQPVDAETEESALFVTQVLVKTIYEAQDVQINDVKGFAREVTQECLDILKQPEKSQARHAIKTICALLSTTRRWYTSG
jgi:DNA repair/transcription protein MET18/MMS19